MLYAMDIAPRLLAAKHLHTQDSGGDTRGKRANKHGCLRGLLLAAAASARVDHACQSEALVRVSVLKGIEERACQTNDIRMALDLFERGTKTFFV